MLNFFSILLLRWIYDVLAVRGHVKVWYDISGESTRCQLEAVLECVGALVHDRSEIGNKFWPAQAACLWWPQQWRQEHHHKHTQHLLWELSMIVSWKDSQFAQWTRMMIPRAAPGCWRLSGDNCEEEEGDINPARYKMCSTLLDSVVGQWPKSSIPHSRQFVYFCPQIALCPPLELCLVSCCHMLTVFTRGDEPVPVLVVGEARAWQLEMRS